MTTRRKYLWLLVTVLAIGAAVAAVGWSTLLRPIKVQVATAPSRLLAR